MTQRAVFISYRREDSAETTGRVADHLREAFGDESVFVDVDSIPLAVDFRTHLKQNIERCAALLVIVGPKWLEARGASGPRLHEENDVVRTEIETGLATGVPVVPILVQRAQMPTQQQLPPSLKEFAFRNAAAVRPDPDFRRDIDTLVSHLQDQYRLELKDGWTPASETTEESGARRSARIERLLAMLLVAAQALQLGVFWTTEANDARLVAVLAPNLLGAALAFLGWRLNRYPAVALGALAVVLPWSFRMVAEPTTAITAAALVVSAAGLALLGWLQKRG